MNRPGWICCQIGAREHYAVPRVLHRAGALDALITDAWQPPGAMRIPGAAGKRFAERFHPDLAGARVAAFNPSLIRFELSQRLRRISGWERIMARNAWFEKNAAAWLRKHFSEHGSRTLFAYSYAALEILHEAKEHGWRVILDQIDPGPEHDKILAEEHARHPDFQTSWKPAPPDYWRNWKQECDLADCIVVNSRWSGDAIQSAGVAAEKIKMIPLAYDTATTTDCRNYPRHFSKSRPLRVLFLGSVSLGKGVAHLLEAARSLRSEPVELLLAGSTDIKNLPTLIPDNNTRWLGSVPRSETGRLYDDADVFIFPSLSDGFGLVQLEAQARRLPIIASRFCGGVVKAGVNGILLDEVSAAAIVDALRDCLRTPAMLQEFSKRAVSSETFGLQKLQQHLAQIA